MVQIDAPLMLDVRTENPDLSCYLCLSARIRGLVRALPTVPSRFDRSFVDSADQDELVVAGVSYGVQSGITGQRWEEASQFIPVSCMAASSTCIVAG